MVVRDQFFALRQKGMVMTYNQKFRAAALKLPTLNPKDVKYHYIHSLDLHIQEKVSMYFPPTLNNAMKLAEEAEVT